MANYTYTQRHKTLFVTGNYLKEHQIKGSSASLLE